MHHYNFFFSNSYKVISFGWKIKKNDNSFYLNHYVKCNFFFWVIKIQATSYILQDVEGLIGDLRIRLWNFVALQNKLVRLGGIWNHRLTPLFLFFKSSFLGIVKVLDVRVNLKCIKYSLLKLKATCLWMMMMMMLTSGLFAF